MEDPTPPAKRIRTGLPVRSALWMAALLGTLVVGSAFLKARHLGRIAAIADWQSAEFRLPRAAYSVVDSENDPRCPDAEARATFLEAMAAYVHHNDEEARRGLLRAVKSAPDWERARFYLGVTGLHLGHPVTAAQNLRRALDRGFETPDQAGRWWLGVAELYCGRREEGRALLDGIAGGSSPLAKSAQDILDGLDHTERGKG